MTTTAATQSTYYVVDADFLALDILDFVTAENVAPFTYDTRAAAEAFAAELASKGYANITIAEA